MVYYTLEEVSKHQSLDDCWIIIKNKVYNVTKFLGEHPGGEEVILDTAGNP
jgi:cytochrome b involved in lipid metabolism